MGAGWISMLLLESLRKQYNHPAQLVTGAARRALGQSSHPAAEIVNRVLWSD